VIDFSDVLNNRFLAVRELKITGLRTPNYNRRADLVCFVNGLPLVFIELKAVYVNIRAAYDGNLEDYLDENVIAHAFHHNAFIVVSNGSAARYGSITSAWDHFAEWKRNEESERGKVDAQTLLDGMLARSRLLDLLEHFIVFDASKAGAVRKVVARNHQVLGVNRAVAAVARQEALKAQFPPGERMRHRVVKLALAEPAAVGDADADAAANEGALAVLHAADRPPPGRATREVAVVERAHPDLGRLGVVWHTQGSGKSYSMALLHREGAAHAAGQFHLCADDRPRRPGHPDPQDLHRLRRGRRATPRASSGRELQRAAGAEPSLCVQPDPQVQPGRGRPIRPTASATTSS
jgi:type I restriction enzyme R subunit